MLLSGSLDMVRPLLSEAMMTNKTIQRSYCRRGHILSIHEAFVIIIVPMDKFNLIMSKEILFANLFSSASKWCVVMVWYFF